jgi:sulfur carrier protein
VVSFFVYPEFIDGSWRLRMQVKINGVAAELPDNYSITELLLSKKLPSEVVIIELNGAIISRGKWASLKLNPNDNLELIRIISGG